MLSRKEVVGVLLLLIALFSCLNGFLFGNILPLNESYEQILLQATSLGTAYLTLLYGLSVWLYHSNYPATRQHMRFVLIAMLILMIVFNVIAALFYRLLIGNLFTHAGIYSNFQTASRFITIIFSVIIILLLIIATMLVVVSTIRTQKKRERYLSRLAENML